MLKQSNMKHVRRNPPSPCPHAIRRRKEKKRRRKERRGRRERRRRREKRRRKRRKRMLTKGGQQKHSAGLITLTERSLAEKAGHLEMLKGGKKDRLDKAKKNFNPQNKKKA
jgi:hypothetical protein